MALGLMLSLGPGAARCIEPVPTSGPVVERSKGGWLLQARGAPTGALVQALARASKSELSADDHALARLRPLRGTVQAATLAAAWQALLTTSDGHALRCERQLCRVWIIAAASTAPTQPARPGGVAPNPARFIDPSSSAALTSDPPGLFPSD